jgi:PhnB protein
MLGVHPYVVFPGSCAQAISFYQSALGAELRFKQTIGESPMKEMGPPDNIMHATIRVGESTIMMADDPSPGGDGSRISLAIGLNEPNRAQELFAKLAEGGAVLVPLQKTYWAEAFGVLIDKFGVKWMINCDAAH